MLSNTTPTGPAVPPGIRKLLVQRFSSRGFELPLLPDTAARILALSGKEDTTAKQLADLLERDPSLATHVLRISNSAAYAPKEPIVSLQQAVSRLGNQVISEIAVAVAVKGRVFDVPGHKVRVREIWIHSAATGMYAKEIARILRRNVEGSFLCGLLHDIGRPLILQTLVDVAREKTSHPVPTSILEGAMELFHCEMGFRMVENFKLPEWMAGTILHHHDYEHATEHKNDAMVTFLADMLAHWSLDHLEEDEFESEHPVLAELGIYGQDLISLLEARQHVLEMAEAFA